jgi:predicted dehydrogenase
MVNIGIIGCGMIAKRRHVPEFAANPDARIVGYFNPTTSRAVEMAEQYGGQVYHSYLELLEDTAIDAVSVCTANSTHAPITIAALRAGKHVLCEKPMATSVEDGEKMIAAARQAGKYLMIAHNQRLYSAHAKAKEILTSGALGRIITFRTAFSHKGPEQLSVAKSADTWFFKKTDAVVGVMGDLGVHKADLVRFLIGDEIREVMAVVTTLEKKYPNGEPIGVDDNAMCVLESENGIIGTLTAGWTNYGLNAKDDWTVVYCAEGVIKLYCNPEYPLEIIKRDGERILHRFDQDPANQGGIKSGIIDRFIDCIVNGKAPEISGEEGLAALKIVFACMESSKTGGKVLINRTASSEY